jgi:dodecin
VRERTVCAGGWQAEKLFNALNNQHVGHSPAPGMIAGVIQGPPRSDFMSVASISEISATSSKSFEDAIQQGIARATKTLRNVRGAWVKEQEVQVENDRITTYKVVLKVTFVLEDTV